jgi:outer membrane lipoprotein SlyB
VSDGTTKAPIWVGMVAGSLLGGWIPTLFGAGAISVSAVIGSVVGGLAGIYLGYQVMKRYF